MRIRNTSFSWKAAQSSLWRTAAFKWYWGHRCSQLLFDEWHIPFMNISKWDYIRAHNSTLASLQQCMETCDGDRRVLVPFIMILLHIEEDYSIIIKLLLSKFLFIHKSVLTFVLTLFDYIFMYNHWNLFDYLLYILKKSEQARGVTNYLQRLNHKPKRSNKLLTYLFTYLPR